MRTTPTVISIVWKPPKSLASARQSIHDVGPEHGFRPAGCNFYTRFFHVEHEAYCEVSGREVSGDGIEIGCGSVYIYT